ncbi:hypothetical protein WNZ14_05315 [Hoeflea sp. AS60]|uniref:lipopolysaccharide biosynthesis protein n=1 Tax=Hoeflea sp. AS60 TaxID=3135780 RepID=UPI003171DE2A
MVIENHAHRMRLSGDVYEESSAFWRPVLSVGKKQSVRSGLLKLGVGSASGYVITLAVSPFLMRLYSPAEFGLFGVFGAIVAMSSILATMSFELGILGAPNRPSSMQFAITAVSLAMLATLFATPIGFLLALWFPQVGLPAWAMAAAFPVCLVAVLQIVAINWAIRTDQTGVAARATFASLAGRSFFHIVFGYVFGGLGSLIAGEFSGRILGWLAAERGTLRVVIARLVRGPSTLFSHISRNRQYAVHVTPSTAIEVALVWVPAPGFALVYGPAAGGFLALVQRLGSAPLTVLNQSMGQLVHRHAGAVLGVDNNRVLRLIGAVLVGTLPLLALLMGSLWLRGAEVAAFVFGEQWRAAGMVALAFTPLYYVQFLSLITNRLILVMGYMRMKLAGSLLHLAILCLSFPAARLLDLDWLGAMALQASALTVSHLLIFLVVLVAVARYRRPGSELQAG